jgi:hypothetical protein
VPLLWLIHDILYWNTCPFTKWTMTILTSNRRNWCPKICMGYQGIRGRTLLWQKWFVSSYMELIVYILPKIEMCSEIASYLLSQVGSKRYQLFSENFWCRRRSYLNHHDCIVVFKQDPSSWKLAVVIPHRSKSFFSTSLASFTLRLIRIRMLSIIHFRICCLPN